MYTQNYIKLFEKIIKIFQMSSCEVWTLSVKDPDGILKKYHDDEWGVPLHDDQKQFEFLSMEVLQCGLSWFTILKKRDTLQACFDNFDFDKVANYSEADVARIMNTPGIIRNEKKIRAIIENARCFQQIRNQFGSFSEYLWKFSDGKTILYEKHGEGYIPASNGLSKNVSDDLKKRGFKFLGEVTIYSHLQSCGIINDHGSKCDCYQRIIQQYPVIEKERDQEKNVKFYKS